MNPWEMLWQMLGWSLLAAVAGSLVVIVVAFVLAGVKAVFKPRKKRGKATQIYSSGDK